MPSLHIKELCEGCYIIDSKCACNREEDVVTAAQEAFGRFHLVIPCASNQRSAERFSVVVQSLQAYGRLLDVHKYPQDTELFKLLRIRRCSAAAA